MKKSVILGTLIIAGMVLAPTTSQATKANEATSNATVTFEASEDKTDPILPTDPEDPDNGGTGNEGALTIDYVSNIQFGLQKVSGGTETYYATNKNPYVQVTDTRGTGAGWLLTASITEFTGKYKGTKAVLKGAQLAFKNGQVKPGASDNTSAMPTASDVVFDGSNAVDVMTATAEEMQGLNEKSR